MATNSYHKFDKMQNMYSNKAFAQTVVTDFKARKRQEAYENQMKMTNT